MPREEMVTEGQAVAAEDRVQELERLCSRLALRVRKQAATSTVNPPPPRCVFSDLDGTLLHPEEELLAAGYSIEPYAPSESGGIEDPVAELCAQFPFPVVHELAPASSTPPAPGHHVWPTRHRLAVLRYKDPSGDGLSHERVCFQLPSLTSGNGYVSLRTIELIQRIREQGCDFVLITGARSSTYLMRRHCGLPVVDYEVMEGGGRMLRDPLAECGPPEEGDRALGLKMRAWDQGWAAIMKTALVGLQRVKEEVRGHGFVVDDRDYATNFRVDVARSTNTGDAAADARMQGLWAKVLGEMEGRGLACSFNLGKADVYPLASGKAPSVQRLMTRLFLDRAECAALFDDDNDVAMAELCANRRFAVSVTHPNVQKLLERDPSVGRVPLPGVLGSEAALDTLLKALTGNTHR